MPKSRALSTTWATFAEATIVLVGEQPSLMQVPPISPSSINATRSPFLLMRFARGILDCPAPIIMASYVFMDYADYAPGMELYLIRFLVSIWFKGQLILLNDFYTFPEGDMVSNLLSSFFWILVSPSSIPIDVFPYTDMLISSCTFPRTHCSGGRRVEKFSSG